MEPTTDPLCDYSEGPCWRKVSRENAELRGLLGAAAGDLEGLSLRYPEHAEVFLAREMRLRRRLHEAGA